MKKQVGLYSLSWSLNSGPAPRAAQPLGKPRQRAGYGAASAALLLWGALLLGQAPANAFTTNLVEKVADLGFSVHQEGAGHGGYAPVDRFTQVGSSLWFTTSKGGSLDLGTVSRFDLSTHQVLQVASLDNGTGSKPESSLTVIGEEAFFTTVGAGVSNKGTIAKINLVNGTVTPLFAFPNNGLPTGATSRGGLIKIGEELWGATQSGGISNRGVILKFNLSSGTATRVADLDGPLLGGQALDGFSQGGNDYYLATQIGGNTFKTTNYPVSILPDGSTKIITNSLTLGAGTLLRLRFGTDGSPVVSKLLDVPGGVSQFLALSPILVGTNSLYFTSVGPNSLPGAISRYNLDSGLLTNLFTFPTNPIPAAQYGTRPGYSGLTEWQGELYFINRNGGTNSTAPNSGGGTVAKFNIASNTVIKLADLGGPVPANDLGSPSGFFGTGTVALETNRFFIYYPLTSGGVNLNLAGDGLGTIIRVALPPQPIQASLALTNEASSVVLSWTGGYPPFEVLTNGDFSAEASSWAVAAGNINSELNTTNWSLSLPAAGTQLFYRIRGQAQ